MADLLRYAAFADDPAGGNPAGIVLDAAGLDEAAMRAIAAQVGYSETAFVTARDGRQLTVRYFSPASEVPFCGHATVATAVALAEREGPGALTFVTPAGPVAVTVAAGADGRLQAELTSVEPTVEEVDDEYVAEALNALGWTADDLDRALEPRRAHAGAGHLVLGVRRRERLARLEYDTERLRTLLETLDCVTLTLVHRRPDDPSTFDARNPFPTGGVVEDPATGAAAAALGAYLRALGLVVPPVDLTIHQGDDMGRPSLLRVHVPPGATSGIRVSGAAVAMPDPR